MARRRRHHYRHQRRIGAVRSKKGALTDIALVAGGAILGGVAASKFLPSMDSKIKSVALLGIGLLGFGSRNRSMQMLSAGLAASGAYGLGRGFNLIGALPAPVGLIPETAQSYQHVQAVGNVGKPTMVGADITNREILNAEALGLFN